MVHVMSTVPPFAVKTTVFTANGSTSLYTNQSDTLHRWAEHFNSVLNQQSSFDHTVLNVIPQWPVSESLTEPPSLNEVQRAIKQLSNGKAPGADRGVQAWCDSTDPSTC